MVHKSAGTKRGRQPAPLRWLDLPHWRRPLDSLLLSLIAAAVAWLTLVAIPAASSRDAVAGEPAASEQAPTSTDDRVMGPFAPEVTTEQPPPAPPPPAPVAAPVAEVAAEPTARARSTAV